MTIIQPMDFEEWWEKQGGDDKMSDRLDCPTDAKAMEYKALFQECFLTGMALGLKKLLLEEEDK